MVFIFSVNISYAQCPAPIIAPSMPLFSPAPTPYCFYLDTNGCVVCVEYCERSYIDANGYAHYEMVVTGIADTTGGCSNYSSQDIIDQAADSLLVFTGRDRNIAASCANGGTTIVCVFRSSCWELTIRSTMYSPTAPLEREGSCSLSEQSGIPWGLGA